MADGPGAGPYGRWNLPFDEWVVAHAQISKKPHRGAKLEDTLCFFHQLATLVNSGTPLLQALKIATAQCESVKLQAVLAQITAKVASGSTFYAAAAAFPQVFEFQWLEAIRTGEVTGKMAQVLVELNKQIRDSRETKKKVKGALMYPMILIVVAVIAVGGDALDGRARVRQDVQGHGRRAARDHPVRGRRLGRTSRSTASTRSARSSRASSGSSGTSRPTRAGGTSSGALMVVPSVGQLMIEMAMYRFASNISLLLKSGVPMIETMHTLTGIFQNNPIYRDALQQVVSKVAAGKSLYIALAGDRAVPPDAHQHGPGRRGVRATAPGDGADLPLLQGEDGGDGAEGHQDGRTDHHHGNGYRRSPG